MGPLALLFKLLTASFTSGHLEQILNQFSKAVLLAASGKQDQRRCIPHALRDLAKLEARPACLTWIAYKWCSAIYENRENIEDWENLLLLCLELGFRHLDPYEPCTRAILIHTEHHRGLVDVVFDSQRSEAIADLLHAWTTENPLFDHPDDMVGICTGRLVGLQNLGPFSPRLRRLVIRSVGIVGYHGFGGAGVEKLFELLDRLHVTAEEIDHAYKWASLLLAVIRSPEGIQRLPDWYWELLAELAVSEHWGLNFGDTDALKIAKSLIEDEEWGKLECWIGVVWTVSESAGITEEDLEHSTLLLFRQRPGAALKLEQWMEQWSNQSMWRRIPEPFKRACRRAHEAVQRQDAP